MVVNDANTRPLVSVLISSYNHADYIEASIVSVLQQTYPHVELLVVDDGSTDGSVERIRRLQALYDFDFSVQANQGLSRTLNGMISRAEGSLIAPFGSDDVMLPDRLEKQVCFMQGKPEIGICAGNVEYIDDAGAVLSRQLRNPARRLNFEDVFLNLQPGASAATLLFRREALIAAGGFDPAIRLEDVYIELKITRNGYCIDVMDDVLAQYRMHPTNTYKNYAFMVDSMLATLDRFSDHPRYKEARHIYLNSMFIKVAKRDAVLARRLLKLLPLTAWNAKTVRGLFRLGLSGW